MITRLNYNSSDSDLYQITESYLKDGAIITNELKNEESNNILSIVTCDGNPEKSINLSGSKFISDMFVTSDGTVYFLDNNYSVEYNDEGGFETTQPEIFRVRKDGTVETVYQGEKQYSEKHYIYAADSKGNLCLAEEDYSDDNMMHVTYISNTGEQTDMTYDTPGYINTILCINDEFNIRFSTPDSFNTDLLQVDKENKTINRSDNVKIPFYNFIDGNNEYDFYYTSQNIIYGYKISDGSSQKIFSWFESDVEYIPEGFTSIAVADPDNIFYIDGNSYSSDFESAPHNPSETNTVSVVHLKKADDARLKELNSRNIITLAGMNITEDNFAKIKQFNKNNNDCMIMATDYSQFDPDTSQDSSAVLGKLQTDIASGNIPDIILGGCWEFDVQSFLSNDALADLNDHLRNDPDIDSSDLAENVLDACSYDGKLYCIPGSISLNMLTVSDEYTDSKEMLTYDEFFSLLDRSGDRPFINRPREEVLRLLLSAYLEENIDLQKSTCNFETDLFKKILEKTKGFFSSESFYQQQCESDISGDTIACPVCRFNSINQLGEVYQYLIGEDFDTISYSVKGIPSSSGITSLIYLNDYLCITDSSENKDDAWKFIKSMINSKKNNVFGSELSILKSENQKNIDSYINDMPGVKNFSDPQANTRAEILKNVFSTMWNGKMICDNCFQKIEKIVNEEAEKYYSDTQSLDETVSAVQNKVKLYLSEIG